MSDSTNRAVEHLMLLDPPTGVTNLISFQSLATQRLQEVLALCQDQKPDKLWSRTYGSYPKAPVLGHVRRLHLVRAVQVVKSVLLSLTVDGLVPETCFEGWERKTEYQQWVFGLAALDLKDLMLSWVKETTAYVACKAFGQIETNEVSLSKVLSAGGDLVPGALGILGPAAVKRACLFLMAPRIGMNPFVQRVRRLAENVLYVKRSCPPMLPHMIAKQLEGHRARVCRVIAEGGRTEEDRRIRLMTKAAIRSICISLFDGARFDPSEVFPSTSASFNVKRVDGGAFGDLMNKHRESLTVNPSSSLGLPVLDRMEELGPGKVSSLYLNPGNVERLTQFSASVGRSVSAHADKRVNAKPGAICEPCKVRVVTIAEGDPYQRAACLQSWLWRVVSGCPTFQYTCHPIGEEWEREFDLNSKENMRRFMAGWFFVSGDYSAATDNLDPELSSFTWETICGVAHLVGEYGGTTPLSLTPWAALGRNALVGHRLKYPDGEIRDQTWGQLMGSPVSFPILNIVNAAATAVSMFLSERLEAVYSGHEPSGCSEEIYRPNTHASYPQGPLEVTPVWRTEDFEGPSDEDEMEANTLRILRDYAVRTNGDDLFFYCPPRSCVTRTQLHEDGTHWVLPLTAGMSWPTDNVLGYWDPYGLWKKVVAKAGLEPSLGKNYTGTDFAVMNSEMRQVLLCEGPMNQLDFIRPRTWRFEAFANLPLIMGMEAKGRDAGLSVLDKLCWWELAPRQAKLLRGLDVHDARYASRISEFERWHKPVLQRVPPGVDYYVPQSLGGAGLAYVRLRPVPQDVRRRAAWLSCLDPVKRAIATSFPGEEPETVWGALIANASRPYVRFRRFSPGEVPTVSDVVRGARSHGSATLMTALRDAELLLDLQWGRPSESDPVGWGEHEYDVVGMKEWFQYWDRRHVKGALSARQRRERAVTQKVALQMKRSKRCGLEPMSDGGIFDWIPASEVYEDEFSPSLRVYATL